MIRQYATINELEPAGDNKLNYFLWNNGALVLIPNDGREGANVKTFGYYGEPLTEWKQKAIKSNANEENIFSNKIEYAYFVRLDNITYNFYNIYNQVKSDAYKITFNYDDSILTVNNKSIKVNTCKGYTIKMNKNSISSANGILSLARFIADSCNCESPFNTTMKARLDRILAMV